MVISHINAYYVSHYQRVNHQISLSNPIQFPQFLWCSHGFLVGGVNPSEKYESQLGWWHTQYIEKLRSCSSHHQPANVPDHQPVCIDFGNNQPLPLQASRWLALEASCFCMTGREKCWIWSDMLNNSMMEQRDSHFNNSQMALGISARLLIEYGI